MELLDINHSNRDGKKDRIYWGSSNSFYLAIVEGRRKTDDLELLCAMCHRKFHRGDYTRPF